MQCGGPRSTATARRYRIAPTAVRQMAVRRAQTPSPQRQWRRARKNPNGQIDAARPRVPRDRRQLRTGDEGFPEIETGTSPCDATRARLQAETSAMSPAKIAARRQTCCRARDLRATRAKNARAGHSIFAPRKSNCFAAGNLRSDCHGAALTRPPPGATVPKRRSAQGIGIENIEEVPRARNPATACRQKRIPHRPIATKGSCSVCVRRWCG